MSNNPFDQIDDSGARKELEKAKEKINPILDSIPENWDQINIEEVEAAIKDREKESPRGFLSRLFSIFTG